mmetsp:Transcript_89666/g.171864  ORF Transcript_89666/g.171864 Transcript_89666/m.171864 type:complete len:245 (+) Transcript_89666:25-759(+)
MQCIDEKRLREALHLPSLQQCCRREACQRLMAPMHYQIHGEYRLGHLWIRFSKAQSAFASRMAAFLCTLSRCFSSLATALRSRFLRLALHAALRLCRAAQDASKCSTCRRRCGARASARSSRRMDIFCTQAPLATHVLRYSSRIRVHMELISLRVCRNKMPRPPMCARPRAARSRRQAARTLPISSGPCVGVCKSWPTHQDAATRTQIFKPKSMLSPSFCFASALSRAFCTLASKSPGVSVEMP